MKTINLQLDKSIIETLQLIIETNKQIKYTITSDKTINNNTNEVIKQLCIRFYVDSKYEYTYLSNIFEFTFIKGNQYKLFLFEFDKFINNSSYEIHDYDLQMIINDILYFINEGHNYINLFNSFI